MNVRLSFLLLLTALFALPASQVNASHLMGGQLTAEQISGMQYRITLTLYRDTTGAPAPGSGIIVVDEVNGPFNQTISAANTSIMSLSNGVEEYIYIDTLMFPNNGEFDLTWNTCCRNPVILNMTNPGAQLMWLNATVTVDPANSTPIFLNRPVTVAPINLPWVYNPLPFDVNGDSLVWSLDVPLGSNGTPVPGYTLPMGSAPFLINSATGEITWTPNAMGHYQASILVEEYRGGTKIGEIRRDMQIIVISGVSANRTAFGGTTGWPVNGNGDFEFVTPPGFPFNLSISATDDDGDMVAITAAGEPFILQQNAATFTPQTGLPQGQAAGDMLWNATSNEQRIPPYLVVFRATETVGNVSLHEDLTVIVYVNSGLSAPEPVFGDFQLYPSPTSDAFSVQFDLQSPEAARIDLLDLQGRTVQTLHEGQAIAGRNVHIANVQGLAAGMYLVRVQAGEQSTVKRLIVE